VDFTDEELQHKGIALLTDQFDAEHEQLFTFKLGDGHEILMIRAVAKAASREPSIMQTASDTSVTLEDCLFHQSRFYFEGQWHDAPIYDRGCTAAGGCRPLPLSSEMDSTTVVLPGYTAKVDTVGNLLINPQAEGAHRHDCDALSRPMTRR
jgi:N-methylhydantoinase A